MNEYMCMLDVYILYARFLENLALDFKNKKFKALKSFEAIKFFVTYVHFEAGRTS